MSEILSSVGGIISQLSTSLTNSFRGSVDMQDEFMSLNSFHQAYRECKSHHEISVLVSNHAKYLKWQLENIRLTSAQICDILNRCLICKALGQDASFVVIHAVQLAQSSQTWHHKHTAYIACCELMDEHSDMAILMVSTLQHDLRSKHVPTICLALQTATIVISSELIPSVEAIICERLKHPTPIVRQKAVTCLGAFLRRDKELIHSKQPYLRTILLDKDPSTMAVGLQVINSLPSENFVSDNLFKPVCFILDQFLNGNAPKKFTKEAVCGPHILVKLLSLLGKIDHGNGDSRQRLMLLLLSTMDKYDSLLSAPAVMVMNECCQLLAQITTDTKHFTRIASYARQLLKSEHVNYHFVSLVIFSKLIKHDRTQISQHQDVIMSALNSTDSVIAEKCIILVIQLTNTDNVQSVYELYSKTSKTTRYGLSPKHAVTILTSCKLSKISIEWFTQKLLELLKVSEKEQWVGESYSHTATLNDVLTYIVESEESAVALYDCLNKLIVQEEMPPLDLLVVMLWTKSTHKVKFSESDSALSSLLLSCCQHATKPYANILALLSAVRSLLLNKMLTMNDEDIAVLKQLTVSSGDESACHVYLEDIKDLAANTVTYDTVDVTDIPSSLWTELEQYKQAVVSSNGCRHGNVNSTALEVKPFKFLPESDIQISTASLEQSVQLRSAKTVWTAKGRVEHEKDHDPVSPESIDSLAPVEFNVEEDEDSTEKLAQNIFSSL